MLRFSYGFLKKKAARSAENFAMYNVFRGIRSTPLSSQPRSGKKFWGVLFFLKEKLPPALKNALAPW